MVVAFSADRFGGPAALRIHRPASIAAMTALKKVRLADGESVTVPGAQGGAFTWDADATDTADDITIFASDEGGVGRWKLVGDPEFATRADAEAAVDSGWVPRDGAIYRIGGLEYEGSTGASGLPDLPGLAKPAHFVRHRLAHYAPRGDGVTNDIAAIRAAVQEAAGKTLYVESGTYLATTAGLSILIPPEGVTIVCEGADQAEIIHDEQSVWPSMSGFSHLINVNDAGSLRIENLAFRGQHETNRTSGACRFISGVMLPGSSLILRDVAMTRSRWFCVIATADRFEAERCVLTKNRRDGFHLQDTHTGRMDRCRFEFQGDDPMHLANGDFADAEGWQITNNEFWFTRGILLSNIKRAEVAHNFWKLAEGRMVEVGITSSEGYSTPLDISIHGNVLEDIIPTLQPPIGQGGLSHILFKMNFPPAAPGSLDAIPGQPDSLGAIEPPHDYYRNATQITDPLIPIPVPMGISVMGNTYHRTLPSGMFSDYGYGLWVGISGDYDFEVTDDMLRPQFVSGNGSAAGLVVADNDAGGISNFVKWDLTDVPSNTLEIIARNNIIRDVSAPPFRFENADALEPQRISICENDIDMDPLHTHSQRLANGKWADSEFGAVIYGLNLVGVNVDENHVRNAGKVIHPTPASNSTAVRMSGNIGYCEPVATGYHADNKGIGNVLSPRYGWNYIIEGSDPASPSTYGSVLNNCHLFANTQPTTGTWVAGTMVVNAGASADRIVGWRRMTTGSGHVAGTDWHVIQIPAMSGNVTGGPDGAIIESGVSSGRAYTIWSNGWCVVTQSRNSDSAGEATATFPVTFTADPHVILTPFTPALNVYVPRVALIEPTYCDFSVLNSAGARVLVFTLVTAMGSIAL